MGVKEKGVTEKLVDGDAVYERQTQRGLKGGCQMRSKLKSEFIKDQCYHRFCL